MMASRKINQRSREKPPIKPFLPILEESGNRPQFLAEQRLGGDKRVEFSKGAQYMFQGPRRSHDSNSIQCRFLQESRWEGYEPPSSYSKGTRKYTRRSRARGYGRPKERRIPVHRHLPQRRLGRASRERTGWCYTFDCDLSDIMTEAHIDRQDRLKSR